jgi:molecular chaperone IbpA
MRTYDFSPLFRSSVGFDRMQSLLDSALDRDEVSYPPYNIETDGSDAYRISVAVAGFDEKALDVVVNEGTLTVTGKHEEEAKEKDDTGVHYLHRGIAGRSFSLRFNLADHIEVSAANLKNGILTIDLQRLIPEEKKPRKIEIQDKPVKSLAEKAKAFLSGDSKKTAA